MAWWYEEHDGIHVYGENVYGQVVAVQIPWRSLDGYLSRRRESEERNRQAAIRDVEEG